MSTWLDLMKAGRIGKPAIDIPPAAHALNPDTSWHLKGVTHPCPQQGGLSGCSHHPNHTHAANVCTSATRTAAGWLVAEIWHNRVIECAPQRQTSSQTWQHLVIRMVAQLNGRSTGDEVLQGADLTGKVAVITGQCFHVLRCTCGACQHRDSQPRIISDQPRHEALYT